MLNVDLRAVQALENHRGVGYMIFLASIVAPSFVAYALTERTYVTDHVLVAGLCAAALGLLITATCALGSFLVLFDGPKAPGGIASAGVRSLTLGIAMSLVGQGVALAHALLVPSAQSFNGYARTALLIAGFVVAIFFVMSFFKESRSADENPEEGANTAREE